MGNRKNKRISNLKNTSLKTILFAIDQVLISTSGKDLQISIYKMNKLINKYRVTISTEKTKTMAFCGWEPARSKIVIDNKIIVQINTFNYLGCSLSYEAEKDIDIKLSEFLKVTGLISMIFKPSEVQKRTRIKIYNTLALPTILYGIENWTMKKRTKTELQLLTWNLWDALQSTLGWPIKEMKTHLKS